MKTISTQPAKPTFSIIPLSITLIIAIIFLSSCTASASSRHHNFEHASPKSIEYHYSPDTDVYYDSTRRVYYYPHRQHGWQSAKDLPHSRNSSKHRRNLAHAKQHQPWKNKHQQKKHKRHYNNHFEKSHKGYSSNGKLFPVLQRKDSHRHEKKKHKSSHPADKILHNKQSVTDHNWLHNSQRRAYGDSQKKNNTNRKVSKKNDNSRIVPSVKQAGQKKQRLQKRARRKGVTQQDEDTHARNIINLRQEGRKRQR